MNVTLSLLSGSLAYLPCPNDHTNHSVPSSDTPAPSPGRGHTYAASRLVAYVFTYVL